MKRIFNLLILLGISLGIHAQTVENIRVVQDGENLKINYRIGASKEAQIFNVFMTCSMNGGPRFEPKAVIGDVGENIIGGKSYYTIVWDVFEDVDEVVNPEFFIRVELVSDMSPEVEEPAMRDQPLQQKTQQETKQQSPPPQSQPNFVTEEEKTGPNFDRNGFFSFNFSYLSWYGLLYGVSFGSLNNWGYYVTPLRFGANFYDFEEDGLMDDFDITFEISAGVTKHIVSAGFYRLHGYGGLGLHYIGENLAEYYFPTYTASHIMLETGVVNVLGAFNLTMGIEISFGYQTAMVFGAGFVF
jgi:hypothetical protein